MNYHVAGIIKYTQKIEDKINIIKKQYFSSGIPKNYLAQSLERAHSNLETLKKVANDLKLLSKDLYVFIILSLSFTTLPLNIML